MLGYVVKRQFVFEAVDTEILAGSAATATLSPGPVCHCGLPTAD